MLASLREKRPPKILTSLCARCLRHDLNLAAVDERDRRIEDHLIPRLDAAIHFDPRALIALHFHLAKLRLTVVDDGDLHSVAVEDDLIVRYQDARRFSRYLGVDREVTAGSQSAAGVCSADFV